MPYNSQSTPPQALVAGVDIDPVLKLVCVDQLLLQLV
jgi:hypothetical protein